MCCDGSVDVMVMVTVVIVVIVSASVFFLFTVYPKESILKREEREENRSGSSL